HRPVPTPSMSAAQPLTAAGGLTAAPSCLRFFSPPGPTPPRPPRPAGSDENAPSSRTPTAAHTDPGGPTHPPRPAASPRTSHATSATPPCGGTSTNARLSSDSANTLAGTSGQTARLAPAAPGRSSPSAPPHGGNGHYPGRPGSASSPGAGP